MPSIRRSGREDAEAEQAYFANRNNLDRAA
jgi:hypothetical protein